MRLFQRIFVSILVLLLIGAPASALADVNDFSFESFDAHYQLSLNAAASNRPEMLVTETLVAVFPQTDQNRGIRREIPAVSYGDKPGLVEVTSVRDENGKARTYEVTRDGDFVSLAIKAKDNSYAHGRQTYVITYRQAWVIRNYQSSSGFDEFYWDINGTGWKQSFGIVKATVGLDKTLQKLLVMNKVACYAGVAGSSNRCDESSVTQQQMVFSAKTLAPGENLTVSVPFRPKVLNTSGPQVNGTPAWFAMFAVAGALFLVLVWSVWYRFTVIKPEGKKSFVIPQYLPADEPGLVASAIIANKAKNLLRALIVDLAIRGEIELALDVNKEDFLIRRTQLAVEGDRLLTAIGLLKAGDEVALGPNSNPQDGLNLRSVELALLSEKSSEIIKDGYYRKRALGLPALVFLSVLVLFAAWMGFALILDSETSAGFATWPLEAFVPFSGVYWFLLSKRALSSKGSEVLTYIKGLEMYIDLAESDRLAFLQSPRGASLKPSESQGKQVLKLYERVLPWAILLGLQKEWSAFLAQEYEREGAPLWIAGGTLLSNNLSSLDAALSASLATADSGGGGGGGSSGGGGGGGGGGGI